MVDDRVALGAEFVNQAADAQLVVCIAAFQRVDFGMNQRFQLGGTRNGALDAFVHRRHFAADSLADRHDALGGNGFRFGETQGHFRHRAGRIAQISSSRHHDREGEEQHDRQQDADDEGDDSRCSEDAGDRGEFPQLAAVDQLAETDTRNNPEERDNGGIADGALDRAAFERTKNRIRGAATGIIGRLESGLSGCRFGTGLTRRSGLRIL